jgi:hypothetical protein
VLGARYGLAFEAVNRIRHGNWFCGVVAAVFGAVVGGMLGAMLTAFVRALLGALAGAALGKLVRVKVDLPTIWFVVSGAMSGVVVQAWQSDAAAAWAGAWLGAIVGASAGPLIFFAIAIVLTRLENTPQ